MKINLNTIKLSVIFIFFAQAIFAQTDSTATKTDSLDNEASKKDSIDNEAFKKDSLNTAILEEYNKKLAEIEQLQIADSLKRVELEAQLNSLKTTDNLKKEELQKQLEDLNTKEINRLEQKKAQIESLRLTASGFPIIGFFDDTLFHVYSRSGSLKAIDRADVISKRIHKLSDVFGFNPDSLKLAEAENTTDIVFNDRIIMSVSEDDAIWNNTSRRALAQRNLQIIADEVMKYKEQTSFLVIAKMVGLAILVLILISILIFYINKFFNWTALAIQQQEGKYLKGFKIKNYTLFDAKRQVNALITSNTILKWLIILLFTYITLPILFGIFPWTQNFAETLFGYILNPVKKILTGLWFYLPNLITIVVIIIVFRYVFRGLNFLKLEIEKGHLQLAGFYADWANPTHQIAKVLLFAFMIVVIFPYLPGSDSPVFQGVSVFLGFLFTFGSAGSLSNIVAGLVLTYMRLFKIGDRVKVGDVLGDVLEKSLLVTRIRTTKNEIISIPNSTIMNSHTINYSSDAPEKGLIIYTTVTIGYDVPWRDMHEVLIEAATRTELVLPEPKPFVLQTSLEDFYVAYQINAYIRESNKQAVIYSNLHQNIQDVCNEKGIEILSPHYRAARDGNMTTIPANYLPKDYKIPNFNVSVKKENDQTNADK